MNDIREVGETPVPGTSPDCTGPFTDARDCPVHRPASGTPPADPWAEVTRYTVDREGALEEDSLGDVMLVADVFRARQQDAADLREARAEVERLKGAIALVLAEPHGCPMCDSGKLRDPAKRHWDGCGFAAMADLRIT